MKTALSILIPCLAVLFFMWLHRAWHQQERAAMTFEQQKELLEIGYVGRFIRLFIPNWLKRK